MSALRVWKKDSCKVLVGEDGWRRCLSTLLFGCEQELLGQYGSAADMFTGAASTAEGVSVDLTAGNNALFAALPEEVSTRLRLERDSGFVLQLNIQCRHALCCVLATGYKILSTCPHAISRWSSHQPARMYSKLQLCWL